MSSSPIAISAGPGCVAPPEGAVIGATENDVDFSALPIATSTSISTIPTQLTTDSSEDLPLKTFMIFPSFPLEIRRLVWQKSLPFTALVPVLNYSGSRKLCPTQTLEDFKTLNSGYGRAFPIALHVNQESRIEVLQRYALLHSNFTVPNRVPRFIISSTDRPLIPTRATLNIDQNLNWKEDCCLSQLKAEDSAKYFSRVKFLRLDSFCTPWTNIEKATIISRHDNHNYPPNPDHEPFCCMLKSFPTLTGVFVEVNSTADDTYLSTSKGHGQLKILRQVLKHHVQDFEPGGLVPHIILIYKGIAKAYLYREWRVMKRAERKAKLARENAVQSLELEFLQL